MDRPRRSVPGPYSRRKKRGAVAAGTACACAGLAHDASGRAASEVSDASTARRVKAVEAMAPPLGGLEPAHLGPVGGVDADAIGGGGGEWAHLEVGAAVEEDVVVLVRDLLRHGLAGGVEAFHQQAHARAALALRVEIDVAPHDGAALAIRPGLRFH